MDSDWVQNTYYLPELSVETDTTIILSTIPCHFYIRRFESKMNRFLLYSDAKINGVPTAVATVHLESQDNSEIRKKQLDVTFQELSCYPKVFLLGDFNFDWATENKNLAPHYVDVWPLLRPGSPGYTMPKTHDFIAWRPDRVLIKKHRKYKPVGIHRLGMEPLEESYSDLDKMKEPENHAIRTPSDHFGLNVAVQMLDYEKEDWALGVMTRNKEKYKEKKKGNFVWIDGTRKGQENSIYLDELEKAVVARKGEIKAFEKVDEGMEDIVNNLEECDDLTMILSYGVLHEILNSRKKELKVIQDKFVHEKHFRLKIVVFTTRTNYENSMHLCESAGFEKFYVFTRFVDLADSLFLEQ